MLELIGAIALMYHIIRKEDQDLNHAAARLAARNAQSEPTGGE